MLFILLTAMQHVFAAESASIPVSCDKNAEILLEILAYLPVRNAFLSVGEMLLFVVAKMLVTSLVEN